TASLAQTTAVDGSETTPAMLERIRDTKSPTERVSLLRACMQRGEPAVDVMIEMLKDEDAEMRKTALQNLKAMSTPGYVVAQNLAEASRQRAREAILNYYEDGKADDLYFPERIMILTGIQESRAFTLLLRALKHKETG